MSVSAIEPFCIPDDRPWLAGRVPDGYWDVRENRVSYLDWLGQRLGFACQDDWYQVSATDFIRNHGGALFWRTYDSSVYIVMRDYQPKWLWFPWLFSKTPKGFWDQPGNRRRYFAWLADRLRFRSVSDWHRLAKQDLCATGGAGLFCSHDHRSMTRLREDIVSMELCACE